MWRQVMKRKFRWVFEGKNKNGEIVFPSSFVIVSRRPAFPYMAVADENGGKLVKLPSEIRITIYEIDESIKYNCDHVVRGHLKLLNGFGDIIEEWIFDEVVMKLNPNSYIDDYVQVDWLVSYGKSEVVYHTPE